MKRGFKLLLLTSTLALGSTIVSCDTSMNQTTNVLYHIDLLSDENVKLETKVNDLASGRKVLIQATILNKEVKLLGIEVSNDIEVTKEKEENTFSFVMPEHGVIVKPIIETKEVTKEKTIEGTYYASEGVSSKDAINNVLIINDDLTYTYTKNNELNRKFEGQLTLKDDHYESDSGNMYLKPHYEDKELIFMLMKFKDPKDNKTNFAIYGKNSFITRLDTSKFEDGSVIRFKSNINNKEYFAYFNLSLATEVTLKNYEDSFKTLTTYELIYDNETIYLRYDGIKLFRSGVERGVYKLTNETTKEVYYEFDGFGNYIANKNSETSETKGSYIYDKVNDYAHLKELKQSVTFDYENKTVTIKKVTPNLVTGFKYEFQTNKLDSKDSIGVSMFFNELGMVEFEPSNIKVQGYKLIEDELTIYFENSNTLKFTLNFDTYKLSFKDGYIYNEGDCSNLLLMPTQLYGTFLVDETTEYIFDTNQYKEYDPNREVWLFSSYHLEVINDKTYVYCGVTIEHSYLELDMINRTAKTVNPIIPNA